MYDIRDDYIAEFVFKLECDMACMELLEKIRWPLGFVCPRCTWEKGYRMREYGLIQCAKCARQTSVTAGTIFHGSRVPLRKWFLAIFLMSSDKKGISALRLHRLIQVSYRTALYMLRKLRIAMGRKNEQMMTDAIAYGVKQIIARQNKLPVRAVLMFDKKYAETEAVTRVYFDDEESHHWLKERPKRNHCMNGPNHYSAMITIALFRRFMLGTYHRTSTDYMQHYLHEFAYRFNLRDPKLMLEKLLTDCVAVKYCQQNRAKKRRLNIE